MVEVVTNFQYPFNREIIKTDENVNNINDYFDIDLKNKIIDNDSCFYIKDSLKNLETDEILKRIEKMPESLKPGSVDDGYYIDLYPILDILEAIRDKLNFSKKYKLRGRILTIEREFESYLTELYYCVYLDNIIFNNLMSLLSELQSRIL